MNMHSVPNSLMGASLGQAHKWVREQMVFSNPGKPMADYTLTDESGKKVSLSDLTRGRASHVTINAAGTVRSNPAGVAEIRGFMEVPKPMHASRLTALTQDKITPALYNAMVKEFGLFGATQTLSILLTRPVSPSLHHTQKTANLIRARKGESLLPKHRFMPKTKREQKKEERKDNKNKQRNARRRTNPRNNPTSQEATDAATALGLGASVPASARALDRAGMLNLDLDKTTTDIRREVDRMLDNAEDAFESGEAGALVSVANRMSLKYENSEEIFNNFAKNVLAPYLITSTANINSLKYINEYILPAMREVIGSSDKARRKLDKQYKYLVNKLATDPKDFYMGTELALIAHPGFLFPRAGLVLMPIPDSKKDMAFRAFHQIGTPPKFDPATGFVAVAAKSDKSGVAYLNRESFENIRDENFGKGRTLDKVIGAVNNLVDVIERYGETDSTGFNVLVKETRSMAAMAGDELYRRIQGTPAFYFADLPGIRPIPTNWPQGLIMAMMEVLGSNRERITGLAGPFSASEFLTPSGINLVARDSFGHPDYNNYASWAADLTDLQADTNYNEANVSGGNPDLNARAEKLLTALRTVTFNSATPLGIKIGGIMTGPLGGDVTDPAYVPAADQRAQMRYNPPSMPGPVARPAGVYTSFAQFLDNILAQNTNIGGATGGPDQAPGHAINYWRLLENPAFISWVNTARGEFSTTAPITAQRQSPSPSVYEIMVDSVELSMRKYNFNPSKDDIYFTTVLLYYSLRNMGLDTGLTEGFMGRISNLVEQARGRTLNKFRRSVAGMYPIGGAAMPLAPKQMNNYLALRYVYEAFNDPNSDAFRQLAGVRVNPAPAVVNDQNIEQMKDFLKTTIDMYEKEIRKTGKDSQAELVFDVIKDLMPAITTHMQEGKTEPLITHMGETFEASQKIIETVNDLYGECQIAVAEHITELGKLVDAIGRRDKDDILTGIAAVQGTSDKLDLLDKTATAMDDFIKYLPRDVSKVEKNYIRKMKDFMILIGDDLQFDKDTAGSLLADVKGMKGTDGVAYSVLAAVMTELDEMRQVIIALNATVRPFENYNQTTIEASTRYSSQAKNPSTSSPSLLVRAYSITINTLRAAIPDMDTFKAEVASRPNISVIDRNGIQQANLFDDFVRSKHSSQKAQALYQSDKFEINSPSDYSNLFETSPSGGQIIWKFMADMCEDAGISQSSYFQSKLDATYKSMVDGLYSDYKRRAKLKEFTSAIPRGTFKLVDSAGKGAKFTGLATLTGLSAMGAAVPRAVSEGAQFGYALGKGAGKAAGEAGAGVLLGLSGTTLAAGGLLALGGAGVAERGGRAFGEGLAKGGIAVSRGASIAARAMAAAIDEGGQALGTALQNASTAISTGLLFGGNMIGVGARGAGAAIAQGVGGGITLIGLGASAATQTVATAWTLYKTRKEIKVAALNQPEVLAAEEARILAIKRNKEAILLEKLADRQVALTRKEEAALQLEVNMLDLGGKRLRLLAQQAKAEEKAAKSDAAKAQARAIEADLNATEERLALEAEKYANETLQEQKANNIAMEELAAEEDLRKRMSDSRLKEGTRQMNYDELAGNLYRAKENRARFVSSIGSEARAKRENITPMKGELGQQFGNVTPAQYLLDLDQSIVDMERKLQGMA